MAISRTLLQAAQKIIDQHVGSQVVIYQQSFDNYDGLDLAAIKSRAFCGNNATIVNDHNDIIVKFEFITN